jgi:hypothetical protein
MFLIKKVYWAIGEKKNIYIVFLCFQLFLPIAFPSSQLYRNRVLANPKCGLFNRVFFASLVFVSLNNNQPEQSIIDLLPSCFKYLGKMFDEIATLEARSSAKANGRMHTKGFNFIGIVHSSR